MGYMRHDAIVVTSFSKEYIEKAHAKAKDLELQCSEILVTEINEYYSFLIGPDGSKEGWLESDRGEEKRDDWTNWAQENEEDIYIDWIHVSYGGDDPQQAHLINYNRGE